MVASRRQLPSCPVCGRADQVKKMQTAYDLGELHVAPPPMPESKASMMIYICVGMILIGVGAFLTLVILVTSTGFTWAQIVQAVITLCCIVTALLLSIAAVRHIGKGDEEVRLRYPIWDEAMSHWNRLLYCSRDKVAFDPQSRKTLSDSSIKDLIDMDKIEQTQSVELAATH